MCSNALKLVILRILIQSSGEDEYVGQGQECREQMGSSQINLGPPNHSGRTTNHLHALIFFRMQIISFKGGRLQTANILDLRSLKSRLLITLLLKGGCSGKRIMALCVRAQYHEHGGACIDLLVVFFLLQT